MNGESVAEIMQARLVATAVSPADSGFSPDLLKGFLHIPDPHLLTVAFDKEHRIFLL